MAIRAPDGAKNGHYTAHRAVVRSVSSYKCCIDNARVCQSRLEYARICKSRPEYARVCQSVPEYARVLPSFAKVVPKSSPSHPQVVPR